MKIRFSLVVVLLGSLVVSPSQTTYNGKLADTSQPKCPSLAWIKWRSKALDDSAASMRRRYEQEKQQFRKQTDSMISYFKYKKQKP